MGYLTKKRRVKKSRVKKPTKRRVKKPHVKKQPTKRRAKKRRTNKTKKMRGGGTWDEDKAEYLEKYELDGVAYYEWLYDNVTKDINEITKKIEDFYNNNNNNKTDANEIKKKIQERHTELGRDIAKNKIRKAKISALHKGPMPGMSLEPHEYGNPSLDLHHTGSTPEARAKTDINILKEETRRGFASSPPNKERAELASFTTMPS